MAHTIQGFDHRRIQVDEGVELTVAVGGTGSPVVLLHGFPQTHLMWRHVAADLAADHTVICPDLRGYGDSDKPREEGPDTYSKRTMANDVVALARSLGHERFALAGHDRGALVAFRAGLDHPAAVSHLACLDVLPTLDMWKALHGRSAAVGFHLYLMAQPPGLPEKMIGASADAFFSYFLDIWAKDPEAVASRHPRGLPGRLPERRAVHCRGLPCLRRDRRGARQGRPCGRQAAHDAGLGPPAGLGRGPRLRGRRTVGRLGHGPGALHRLLRSLHGRGGVSRHREGVAGPDGPLSGRLGI